MMIDNTKAIKKELKKFFSTTIISLPEAGVDLSFRVLKSKEKLRVRITDEKKNNPREIFLGRERTYALAVASLEVLKTLESNQKLKLLILNRKQNKNYEFFLGSEKAKDLAFTFVDKLSDLDLLPFLR